MSEPAIEAWISKGLALAEDIAQPTAGAKLDRASHEGRRESSRNAQELAELRKRDD